MNLPTQDQVNAALRHGGTIVASVVGTLVSIKLFSAGDATQLMASLNEISDGVAKVLGGLAALAAAATTIYASFSANPLVQLARGMFNLNKSDPAAIAQTIRVAPLEQKAALVQAANEVPSVVEIPLAPTEEGKLIAAAVPSSAVDVVK